MMNNYDKHMTPCAKCGSLTGNAVSWAYSNGPNSCDERASCKCSILMNVAIGSSYSAGAMCASPPQSVLSNSTSSPTLITPAGPAPPHVAVCGVRLPTQPMMLVMTPVAMFSPPCRNRRRR